jgi:hypothetical protein
MPNEGHNKYNDPIDKLTMDNRKFEYDIRKLEEELQDKPGYIVQSDLRQILEGQIKTLRERIEINRNAIQAEQERRGRKQPPTIR